MSNHRLDLKDKKFNKWTVLELKESINGRTYWFCRCECGNQKVLAGSLLTLGKSTSCGCNRKGINQTHGLSNSKLYDVYKAMISRCTNPSSKDFPNYGGRGIKVCGEWGTVTSFYNWAINNGYQNGLTLDRQNPDGNYNPDNCRWVSQKAQANNKTCNRIIEFNGISQTLQQWADSLGIKRATLSARLNQYGWSIEKALNGVVANES